MENINNGASYAPKMDNIMTKALKEWYMGLTKEELLAYLAEQPSITADVLRDMLSNMNCVLAFDVRFSASSNDAATDFHTGK